MLRRIVLVMLALSAGLCLMLAGAMRRGRVVKWERGPYSIDLGFDMFSARVERQAMPNDQRIDYRAGPFAYSQKEVVPYTGPSFFVRGVWVGPGGSWHLVAASAALGLWPTVALIRFVRRRRLSPRYCAECEYDLTGNESGVCPECGEAV